MTNKKPSIVLLFIFSLILPLITIAAGRDDKLITISTPKISMVIDINYRASITSLVVNGQAVVNNPDGIYTSVKVGGVTYSSLAIKGKPLLATTGNITKISGIVYGDKNLTITENWIFSKTNGRIKWTVERALSKPTVVEEASMPVITFDSINTWEGAYQGYGGLAWFYLFNEKLNTYGVHTRSSNFWNSKTGNGLNITVDAPAKQVAMKYTRTADDKLAFTITTSAKQMIPLGDSDTHRRLFLPNRTNVWSPFAVGVGVSSQSITFSYFDYNAQYGRGKLVGLNGDQVSAVLGTIARIGVIDSLHYGGNSWHTPYGPICLHEQYIAQLGLGINDPAYLKGYQSCLDFYRDHAILPDGRVYPRWAYTNEDAMPGRYNKDGFYEAQWGILMDSNPDFVTNVAELYDMTGNTQWVKTQQLACEKALAWILNRDSNHNGLVEMMTDVQAQKKSSDWIDIIWASYENAFVNANLYHALVKWAGIERQLHNNIKAVYYENFAAKLKASFNKPVDEGGFWDPENSCYVHWIDKDKTIHGRNMVTPVNFMAIAYGICDDDSRKKLILDKIEVKMEQEKLFFWPICMTTYAKGEGNDWQFPFPNYENGDLFLSWGSVAVAAYAGYKPELAVKYVKNVLEQYSKDGLAFQRYGRAKQDGRGDDILSGNSLSIVGLYQAIYGANPLYNRFYLNPHITPELAGTELKYNYQNQRLTINLDNNSYSVSNGRFKVTSDKDFGFFAGENSLSYFDGSSGSASLQITTTHPLSITIKTWSTAKMEWEQAVGKGLVQPLVYHVNGLKANTEYHVLVNGKVVQRVKSTPDGVVVISRQMNGLNETVSVEVAK